MSADTEFTDSPETPPPEDLPPGPEGWEAFVVRRRLARLDALRASAGEVDGVLGADDGADALPPASDLEELASAVLTALYGPPTSDTIPERFRGDADAEEAYRRIREAEARGKRRAALEKLARRFARPIHPRRWQVLEAEAVGELERRRDEIDARTPWWNRPDAPGEAQRRAVFLALADDRVQTARIDQLEARIRAALQDSYAADVAGPDWSSRSDSGEKRRRREELEAAMAESETRRLTVDPARDAELRMDLERRQRAVGVRAEELSEAQRAVYLAVERDGFTPAEVAEDLGISPAAARNRLKRARERLRETA